MNERDRHLIRELSEQVDRLVHGDFAPLRLSGSPGPEIDALADALSKLADSLAEAREFVLALSRGQLELDPPPRNQLISPFKQLQANLRHLTWQTQQIVAGDLNQRVDFMGEFSVAFNSLIQSLLEKRLAEERLRYLSNHDPLTDLYNRGYFTEEMERIERGRRFPVSIMMADLDGLKRINDTLGHAAGDRLILQAARLIRHAVRGDDVVARMGGDEFAVILPNTDSEIALMVCDRIRSSEAAFNLECSSYVIGISIGIATAEQGGSLAEALREADERMYKDKFARKKKAGKSVRRPDD
jgi:two-component system, cell cycle response regulator